MRFSDERWEAAEETDWGAPVDTHPHPASSTPWPPPADAHHWLEHQGGGENEFRRYPRRPVCTECRAPFTDERWKAVERGGWGTPQERHQTLCGTCAHAYDTSLEEPWPGERSNQMPMPEERQDHAAVPKPKAGGWFSRLHS